MRNCHRLRIRCNHSYSTSQCDMPLLYTNNIQTKRIALLAKIIHKHLTETTHSGTPWMKDSSKGQTWNRNNVNANTLPVLNMRITQASAHWKAPWAEASSISRLLLPSLEGWAWWSWKLLKRQVGKLRNSQHLQRHMTCSLVDGLELSDKICSWN